MSERTEDTKTCGQVKCDLPRQPGSSFCDQHTRDWVRRMGGHPEPKEPGKPIPAASNQAGCLIGIGGVVLLVMLVWGCSALTNDDTPSPAARTPSGAVDQMGAVEQMSIAFQGSWSEAEIQQRVDRALQLYGEPVTETTRSRAGSGLVAMGQESGVSEMEILDHMICSHVPGVAITFAEMAAMSATFAASGDRCG